MGAGPSSPITLARFGSVGHFRAGAGQWAAGHEPQDLAKVIRSAPGGDPIATRIHQPLFRAVRSPSPVTARGAAISCAVNSRFPSEHVGGRPPHSVTTFRPGWGPVRRGQASLSKPSPWAGRSPGSAASADGRSQSPSRGAIGITLSALPTGTDNRPDQSIVFMRPAA